MLPPGTRPRHNLCFKVYNAASAVGFLRIYPDGTMYAHDTDVAGAQQALTCLGAISFPVQT